MHLAAQLLFRLDSVAAQGVGLLGAELLSLPAASLHLGPGLGQQGVLLLPRLVPGLGHICAEPLGLQVRLVRLLQVLSDFLLSLLEHTDDHFPRDKEQRAEQDHEVDDCE